MRFQKFRLFRVAQLPDDEYGEVPQTLVNGGADETRTPAHREATGPGLAEALAKAGATSGVTGREKLPKEPNLTIRNQRNEQFRGAWFVYSWGLYGDGSRTEVGQMAKVVGNSYSPLPAATAPALDPTGR